MADVLGRGDRRDIGNRVGTAGRLNRDDLLRAAVVRAAPRASGMQRLLPERLERRVMLSRTVDYTTQRADGTAGGVTRFQTDLSQNGGQVQDFSPQDQSLLG